MALACDTVARHAMRRLLGPDSWTRWTPSRCRPDLAVGVPYRWIPADEAYKLERAFDVDLSRLCGLRRSARQSGRTSPFWVPQERKGMKLRPCCC